jgi:AbiV family abortive infection protein
MPQILNMGQIAQGMDSFATNAEELLLDAETLMLRKSYARAYVLAQIACEELGKVPILYAAATKLHSGLEPDWRAVSRELKDHGKKTFNFVILGQFVKAIAEVDRSASRGEQIDQVLTRFAAFKWKTIIGRREAAIYAGLQKTHFVRPPEMLVSVNWWKSI